MRFHLTSPSPQHMAPLPLPKRLFIALVCVFPDFFLHLYKHVCIRRRIQD